MTKYNFLVITWLAIASVSQAGEVWLVNVEVNAVNELHSRARVAAGETTATTSSFDYGFYVYRDADGARLLGNALIASSRNAEGNCEAGAQAHLLTSVTISLGLQDWCVLQTLLNTAVPFDEAFGWLDASLGNDFSSESGGLVFRAVLSADHALNPFRHRYHPDRSQGRQLERVLLLNDMQEIGSARIEGVFAEHVFGITSNEVIQPNVPTSQNVNLTEFLNSGIEVTSSSAFAISDKLEFVINGEYRTELPKEVARYLFRTKNGDSEWVKLEFPHDIDVSHVRVVNRVEGDVFGYRMKGKIVQLLDEDGEKVAESSPIESDDVLIDVEVAGKDIRYIKLDKGISSSYVDVQEVEVYGPEKSERDIFDSYSQELNGLNAGNSREITEIKASGNFNATLYHSDVVLKSITGPTVGSGNSTNIFPIN